MGKKAVDVVLLPDDPMMAETIEANRNLVGQVGDKIVLNKENCLPHVSLAMGCADEGDIDATGEILKNIAKKTPVLELRIVGVWTTTNSAGEKISAFGIEKAKGLQLLHEEVMEKLTSYLSYDVTREMMYDSGQVSESTLLWIREYREKSSFANFSPHITIGYGQMENVLLPMEFTASRLALCHLGNHCTCRDVLISIGLGT
ncbi:MAG: 2'-5' RNA ligase family protein [Planctomycetota bacterium]|jgi:2'-5' RNA ligase